MPNIFLVSHILLLFHSPKGSWNNSAKYEKHLVAIICSKKYQQDYNQSRFIYQSLSSSESFCDKTVYLVLKVLTSRSDKYYMFLYWCCVHDNSKPGDLFVISNTIPLFAINQPSSSLLKLVIMKSCVVNVSIF